MYGIVLGIQWLKIDFETLMPQFGHSDLFVHLKTIRTKESVLPTRLTPHQPIRRVHLNPTPRIVVNGRFKQSIFRMRFYAIDLNIMRMIPT